MLKAKTIKVPRREIALLPSDTPKLSLEKEKYSAKFGLIIYAMVET